MQIADGFKISSVVIYPDFGQVNGEYIREVPLQGAGNSTSFNMSVEEARNLIPGRIYTVNLEEQSAPAQPVELASNTIDGSKIMR
jgi:hypothetical protein